MSFQMLKVCFFPDSFVASVPVTCLAQTFKMFGACARATGATRCPSALCLDDGQLPSGVLAQCEGIELTIGGCFQVKDE